MVITLFTACNYSENAKMLKLVPGIFKIAITFFTNNLPT